MLQLLLPSLLLLTCSDGAAVAVQVISTFHSDRAPLPQAHDVMPRTRLSSRALRSRSPRRSRIPNRGEINMDVCMSMLTMPNNGLAFQASALGNRISSTFSVCGRRMTVKNLSRVPLLYFSLQAQIRTSGRQCKSSPRGKKCGQVKGTYKQLYYSNT